MPLTIPQLRELSAAFPARGASRHDPASYPRLREQIFAAIAPFAAGLEFELDGADPIDQDALLALPPHIFLAWCEDHDAMAYFYALPEADLSEAIARALVMVEGHTFAGRADLAPEQWGAALRLMAAIGTPFARDAADFHATYVADGEDHEELPDLAELELLFDQFAPRFIASAAGLHRRFTRVIAITHAV